ACGFKPATSNIKAEMHDVAVLDDVIGAFEAHLAGILGALLAATGDEIGIGDRLGADKALLEIAVDDAGGLRRLGAARDRPGARLLWARREKGDQIEERVSGADHLVEPGFAEAKRGEKLRPLGGVGEDGELGFDRRGNADGL